MIGVFDDILDNILFEKFELVKEFYGITKLNHPRELVINLYGGMI